MSFHGKILVEDCSFQLSAGRRYGLVGPNGCGKTTLLRAIGAGEVPIPSHIDVYHLEREAEASDKTPLQCVLECAAEKQRIEAEIDELTASMGAGMTEEESDDINARISELMDRLELLDASKAEARAARILCGLGFSAADLQNKKAREFSGGWRMRIALARALFVQPTLLILDEPTNHLDMESVVWLEQYLQSWNPRGIILLVSHSQDFLNRCVAAYVGSACSMMHATYAIALISLVSVYCVRGLTAISLVVFAPTSSITTTRSWYTMAATMTRTSRRALS